MSSLWNIATAAVVTYGTGYSVQAPFFSTCSSSPLPIPFGTLGDCTDAVFMTITNGAANPALPAWASWDSSTGSCTMFTGSNGICHLDDLVFTASATYFIDQLTMTLDQPPPPPSGPAPSPKGHSNRDAGCGHGGKCHGAAKKSSCGEFIF